MIVEQFLPKSNWAVENSAFIIESLKSFLNEVLLAIVSCVLHLPLFLTFLLDLHGFVSNVFYILSVSQSLKVWWDAMILKQTFFFWNFRAELFSDG